MLRFKPLIIFLMVVSFSGCCMFMPCHPGTRVVGYVSDIKGQPIEGATVKLYAHERTTNANGCFSFDVADRLPFSLAVNAAGFKDAESPSKAGFFIMEIKMVPTDSIGSSEVIWKEINNEDYRNAKQCN